MKKSTIFIVAAIIILAIFLIIKIFMWPLIIGGLALIIYLGYSYLKRKKK